MKMKRQKIRMILTGLVAAGFIAACAQSGAMMEKPMADDMHDTMATEMTNMLTGSKGHHASGHIAFDMGMGDTHVLKLENIDIDKVPDGRVYLTRGADRMHGVELGALTQFTGSVSFVLPAAVNPADYDSVVIWCETFKVEIGRGFYTTKMM